MFKRLYDVILARRQAADPQASYVAALFAKGNKKIAQKVGEEAVELAIASTLGKREEIVAESADLVFHMLVLWAAHGITPEDVAQELERREKLSGLEEKAQRGK